MSAPRLQLQKAALPGYGLFRTVCDSGLSAVRPLGKAAAADDPWGWNFGRGWPPSYWAYGRMRAVTALLEAGALKPKSVLEIAAGDAALSACLAATGCRVAANDLRGDQLAMAVRNFSNHVSIQPLPGNLFDLDPGVTGLFDLVIACEIVEHVAHTPAFLAQLKRFVAPGGHILITTPNGAYFRNKLPTYSAIQNFDVLETEQFKPDADGHLFLITPAEMAGLAEEAGLRVERMVVWGTPPITGHLRLSVLACEALCWLCYHAERLSQDLPPALKTRVCFNLAAVLKAA